MTSSGITSQSLNRNTTREGDGEVLNHDALRAFEIAMMTIKRSPVTIHKRMELLNRLADHLGDIQLLAATLANLYAFQVSINHLAPASLDIYTRHIRAFYSWARTQGLIDADPAAALGLPKVNRGVPHPTLADDLRMIFRCAPANLRLAYVLAAFTGLRCGEITRLRYQDLDLDSPSPTAIIQGKGGRQRTVPLFSPVVHELRNGHRGWVITRSGKPFTPPGLSTVSSKYLASIGIDTTLHSMRHYYATMAVRITKDPLLVRDLLGHVSVQTTEIYMQNDTQRAHRQLEDFVTTMNSLLGRRDHLVIAS